MPSSLTRDPLADRPGLPDRMRIVHAVFSSRLAGSERYCAELANQQAALGHDVHVVGLFGSPIAGALSSNVRFHGIGRLLSGFRLRRLVRHLSPDVCHGHLSTACKALGRAHRPVRVATLHVGYKSHQHGKLDGLICVNRAQSKRLDGYRGTVRSIPNWLPAAPARASRRDLRRELGLKKNCVVIGTVGRLHESKGADVLLSAFRATAPADAALVFVGEGPQRRELERLADGDRRIHFLGYCGNVHACLQELDLFVSPSREESFGLAIIEAMSAGLPVIATSAEGPAEYLRDQPVTLVPPGDAAALGTALAESISLLRAAHASRRIYDLADFDPAVRVANIMDFYRGVIAGAATDPAREWVPTTVAAT